VAGNDMELVVFALIMLVLGVILIGWPERARAILSPNYKRYERLPFGGTSLWSLRFTGAGAILMALVLIYAISGLGLSQ